MGSIIVGTKKTLDHCRWVRKSIGGGIRQAGVIASAARVAVEEQFGKGPNGEGGKLQKTHEYAKKIESMWVQRGGRVSREVHTNMVLLDLVYSGISAADLVTAGKEEGLKLLGPRVVVHYQIVDEAVERLGRVMDRVFAGPKSQNAEEAKSDYVIQGETSKR